MTIDEDIAFGMENDEIFLEENKGKLIILI